jgi:hypothetical protein
MIVDVFPSGSASVGDLALIEYFEWLDGTPSTRQLIPLTALASARTDPGIEVWVLYANTEEMKDHYERVDHRLNEWKRRAQKAADAQPESSHA